MKKRVEVLLPDHVFKLCSQEIWMRVGGIFQDSPYWYHVVDPMTPGLDQSRGARARRSLIGDDLRSGLAVRRRPGTAPGCRDAERPPADARGGQRGPRVGARRGGGLRHAPQPRRGLRLPCPDPNGVSHQEKQVPETQIQYLRVSEEPIAASDVRSGPLLNSSRLP